MKQKGKIIFIILLGLIFFNFVYAQSPVLVSCGGRNPDGSSQTPCQVSDLIFLIERIINFLLSWAWIISILFILWAGWQLITAAGNDEQIAKGKEILKQAILGFFIIMIAYILINLVIALLSTGDPTNANAFNNIRSFLPLP